MTRENAEFFEEYYKKLILIDQVEAFNRLVERQCHLQNLASQKASLAPFREGNQHMPADSPHVGYNIPKMLSNPSNRNQQRSTVSSHDNYGVPAPVLENYRRLMARKGNAPDKVPVSPIMQSEIPNPAPDNNQNISNFSLFPTNSPTDQQGHGFVDSRLQFPRSSSVHLQRSSVSSNHSEDAAANSSYLAHMNNGGGMALDSNAADRTQYFGNHNLTETSYSGAKDRHPLSTSSLPPPVEQQWQHLIEPQWHHFIEQQGFDWSSARKIYELTGAHENPASTTLIGSQESSSHTVSNYNNRNPEPGSFHPAQMNYERGMAMYENEAPPFQIPNPVSVERPLTEYDFILSRDPFSSSSLAHPIEKQGQPSTQQQGQHFMEQQGTGFSFHPAQMNYERG
uniref:Uncharacterized protein n=1 Tax=Populus alba TaxID=43335 RepID=A0A4U5R1A8_POPAL|nr:uncharacterized protein LOC118057161 [Populus alba]TKS17328.1 hypothetical protein D5086_0000014120 [Populus alba]